MVATMPYHWSNTAALTAFLLLVTTAPTMTQGGELSLKQIHVITRHGSRLPLIKHAETLKEGTTTLTHYGQKQLFDLGVWIKERYNHATGAAFNVYDPSQVRLESSSFDRTIVSANSLALGLFNVSARDPWNERFISDIPANIPVYTRDAINDITIRAYDKCASGMQLDELYKSQEWTEMENVNLDLLKHLGNIYQFSDHADDEGKVPLKYLWNVFDAINVAQTECLAQPLQLSCSPERKDLMNILTDQEWEKVQLLSHQAEFLKYGRKSIAKFIGSNLLSQIFMRMKDIDSKSVGFDSFYMYSAHYPTLIGMMTLLGDDDLDREVIPEYSSALIFEFYHDDTSLQKEEKIRVVYRPGDGSSYRILYLDETCTSDGYCSFPSVQGQINNNVLSQQSWCEECSNDTADVCLREKYNNHKSERSSSSNLYYRTITSFFVGSVLSVFILVGGFRYYNRRRAVTNAASRNNIDSGMKEQPTGSYV